MRWSMSSVPRKLIGRFVSVRRRHGSTPAGYHRCVARANDGNGVIILTDMFGGTPSNLAISVMNNGNVEVIAGVNLPMLIKLAGVRSEDNMDKAFRTRPRLAAKYINVASRVLSGK